MTKSIENLIQILVIQSTIFLSAVIGIHWDHSINLDDDYRLLWSISKPQTSSFSTLHQDKHHQSQQRYQQQQHLQTHQSSNQEITFEIQVRTLGYIGFGFSWDGRTSGADIVIGWVDNGQTYFQVIYMLFYFISVE